MKNRTFVAGLGLAILFGCRAVPEPVELVGVEFHTDPAGADVWIDGVLAGHTPLEANYEWAPATSQRTVEFRMPGYLTEKRAFTPDTAMIAVRLQEAVGAYVRRVESEPPGATIELDDKPAGTTPTEVRYGETNRTLRVILPGYRSESVRLDGTKDAIKIRLQRLLPRLP